MTRQIEKKSYSVAVEKDIAVPMRDGTVLRGDVYHPDNKGRYPTIVTRTAYNKSRIDTRYYEERGRNLAERGYTFVAQDIRGTYASEGDFFPCTFPRRPPRHRGRLRHDRVGGKPAVVDRQGGHRRQLLRRLDAVGARPREAPAPDRHDAPGHRRQHSRPGDERRPASRSVATVDGRQPGPRPDRPRRRAVGPPDLGRRQAAVHRARPQQVDLVPAAHGDTGRGDVRCLPPLAQVARRARQGQLRLPDQAAQDRGAGVHNDKLVRPAGQRTEDLQRHV